MPNKELADWQKIVIMATTPFFGNRAVAKKAECSVWSVRKYRNKMKEEKEILDISELDDERAAMVAEEGIEILDEVVDEGLNQGRGRI